MALTETHRPGTGVVVLENGNLFINSGRLDGIRMGVGVVLSKRVKNSLISYTPVSERVMWLRLHSKQVNVSVVVAYAPTEDAEDSVKDGFYNEVTGVLDGLPGQDVVFLTGDFNARVGSSDSESVSGVVGKHSLHAVSNNNGKRLVDLCTLYGLVIGGSLFEHLNIHKGTWKSPDGRTVTQIDHICVSSRWKSSLLDVRSYRGADIGSDHYLVGGRFRLRLRANGRRKGERVAVPDLQKLRNGSKIVEYQVALKNRFDQLDDEVDLETRFKIRQLEASNLYCCISIAKETSKNKSRSERKGRSRATRAGELSMTGAGQSREDPCVQTGTKRSSHCNRVISCAITEVSPDLSKQNPYNLVKYSFKISTWNVLSLESSSSKLYELARVTSEYETDVMALTETHRPGTGVVVLENGNLFINSGRLDGIRRRGVGVVLSKRVKNSLISYTPVSERVMWLRLHSKQVNVSVVVAYAPTEDAEDSVKDGFYNEVTGVLDGLPGQDVVFLTGDFNARVGSSDSESVSGVVGKHSLHAVSNNNGKRLVDLCTLYGLVIGGSLFEHLNIHKGTWKSPDGRTVTQIDHICVSSRWKSSLLDVRSYRGADIGSDHYLVGGRFRLRLRANGRRKGERVAVPDLQKLRNGSKIVEYQVALKNRFDQLDDEVDLETRWEGFRKTISDTSLEILGKRPAQNDDRERVMVLKT
eukprot:sb/3462625/